MSPECADVKFAAPTTGIFQKAWNLLKAVPSYFLSLGNPSDHTTEIQLWAFGAFVTVGLTLIWAEFWGAMPHHINNTALATMAGACTLQHLSGRLG